jgi:hypothetical protein
MPKVAKPRGCVCFELWVRRGQTVSLCSAHLHRGHKKFAGLESTDHILGGKSFDGLPVNIMRRSQLSGGAHLEMEIRNDRLRSEKIQRT